MLDMLTDRCSTMCLLVNLALLYPRATLLFQLSMSLDVASHWLHLHRSALMLEVLMGGKILQWEGDGDDSGSLGGVFLSLCPLREQPKACLEFVCTQAGLRFMAVFPLLPPECWNCIPACPCP